MQVSRAVKTLFMNFQLGRKDWILFSSFPAAKLLLHLSTYSGYGYFRDEFYYLACSRHLDWGYVDHPPLSVLILWIMRHLLGESLFALRLVPALAGAACVLLAGLIARELGGNRPAQTVAMAAVLSAPIYLALDHFYSMNSLDLLFWALAAWLLVRICKENRTRSWLFLGIVLGLGLQNKISVLWLGFGLAVGILLSRRNWLRQCGPWIAAGLAGLIFLPHLIWQISTGWPTLEFIQNATSQKMAGKSLLEFSLDQIRVAGPVALPLWLLGLGYLCFSPKARKFRILAWMFLAVFLLLGFSGSSRSGYLAPAYIWLFAAGGIGLTTGLRASWVPPLAVSVLLVEGVFMAPLALPVLPVESYIRYARFLGIQPDTEERKELAELPQFFADMHGWPEIVKQVERVSSSLEPEEREKAVILTPNYGDAGALELLGHGLPPVVSGHNSYWLWGPRGRSGEVMIILGSERADLERYFFRVELAGRTDCGYCMPYENHVSIWVCRSPVQPLAEVWSQLKHFD